MRGWPKLEFLSFLAWEKAKKVVKKKLTEKKLTKGHSRIGGWVKELLYIMTVMVATQCIYLSKITEQYTKKGEFYST